MTDKDIIEMAQKAGLHLATDVNWMPIISLKYAKKFAELVAAHEREACAKLCEDIESEAYGKHRQKYDPYDEGFAAGALACIEAIRARSEK